MKPAEPDRGGERRSPVAESRVGVRWLVGVWSVACLLIAGALGLGQSELLTALERSRAERQALSEDLARIEREQATRRQRDSARLEAARARHEALVERLRDQPSASLRERAAALSRTLLPSATRPRSPDRTAVEEALDGLLTAIRLRERCLDAGVATVDSRRVAIAEADLLARQRAELDADLDAAVGLATLSGRELLARRLLEAAPEGTRSRLERRLVELRRERGDAFEARARALVAAVAELPRDSQGAARLRALAAEAAALDDSAARRIIESLPAQTASAVAARASAGRAAWRPVERDLVAFALMALADSGRPRTATRVIAEFLADCRDGELQLEAGVALCRIAGTTPPESGVNTLEPLLALGRQVGFSGPVWSGLRPWLRSLPERAAPPSEPLSAAVLALLRNQPEAALERTEAVLTGDPGRVDARRLKVRALLALGRHEAAAKVAGELLSGSGADVDRRLTARALIGLDQKPAALSVLNEGHDASSRDPRLELLRAQLLRESGALIASRRAIERSLRLDSESSAAWFEYARLQQVSEALEKAHDSASRGLRLDRENIAGLLLRSRIRRALRQWGPAMDDLSLILTLDPTHREALRERGLLLAALGRSRDAQRDLDALIAAHPKSAESYLARAVFESRRGRHAQALEDIQRALGEDPKLASAHAARADVLLRLRRLEEAAAEIARALELAAAPGVDLGPEARRLKASWRLLEARVCWSLGRLSEALQAIRVALELDPSSVDAGELGGHIAEQLGLHEEALAACRGALTAARSGLGHSHGGESHSHGGESHSHSGESHSHGGESHSHDKHDHGEGPHSHDAVTRLTAAVARLERRIALIERARSEPEARRELFRAELERARRAPPIFAADPLRRALGLLGESAPAAAESRLEAKRRRELARVAADKGCLDLALRLRRRDLPADAGAERSRALVELAAILLRAARADIVAPEALHDSPKAWLAAFKDWRSAFEARGRKAALAERRQSLKERALALLREAAKHPPGVELSDRKAFRMLIGEPGWAELSRALSGSGEAGPAGPPVPETTGPPEKTKPAPEPEGSEAGGASSGG